MSTSLTIPAEPATLTTRFTRRLHAVLARFSRALWLIRHRLGPVDERGGARNSDEALLIAGGIGLGLVILAAGGAFVARQMGVLQ